MPAHSFHADDDLAVLASSPLCQVSACPGCGVVHLHLPSMTLRFEPAAFHEMARLVAQASLALEGRLEADAEPDERSALAQAVSAAPVHPATDTGSANSPAVPPSRRRWH